MSDWPMKSSDIKVLTRMHLQRIKDKKEEETVTTPPTQTETPDATPAAPDDADERRDRKRAASGEADDTERGDQQPASSSSRGTLPVPALPGVNMRDAAEVLRSQAARNKRNLETLRAQAQAEARRRVQADRRGGKRGTEEPVHPEEPRAANPDDHEISLVGTYGTRCGCCEEVFESSILLFQPLRDDSMR